ncbi:MAG: hypothetical protein GC150_16515 [Rhizobiales bacterium]|nr:hypothetical protein [Hyphomicrobiales bacterium]
MQSRELTVGIIGVGHLMRHLVPGMLRTASPPRLLLGPRSRADAEALASAHGLEIAADNADVVCRSDLVVVAVRPPQTEEAMTGLPWRAGQTVLSLMAGVTLERLARIARPATVVRAMPVVAGLYGESATSLHPENAAARTVLTPLGAVVALETEELFEKASILGAGYGWLQVLANDMIAWLESEGIEPAAARTLVAQTMRASATTLLERRETTPGELVAELISPGSLTGQGRDILMDDDYFRGWRHALDAIRDRLLATG